MKFHFIFHFIQTAQQEKEGLVIGAIFVIILIIGAIYGAIDRGNERSDLSYKANTKYARVTLDDVYQARNYLDDDILANKLHEKYIQQLEEDNNKALKKKANEFELKEYKDADLELKEYIEMLEYQTNMCNKCNSAYMRIWFLSDSLLELRCDSCKKKFKYYQEDLNQIGLNLLIKKLNNNNKRHNDSYENEFIRESVIKLDFNGHKANSPEWYYYTLSPEKDAGSVKQKVNQESYRSRRITQEVMDSVWNRDGGKCIQCGSNENLEFDHIIPHSKGGANTYRNIQLLCEKCNRSKSAKIG
jgi:hypothetical protein